MNNQLSKIPKQIRGSLPLTVLDSKVIANVKRSAFRGIKATDYKSNNVNPQQFYKPISKILHF